jgi:hypothetical protein
VDQLLRGRRRSVRSWAAQCWSTSGGLGVPRQRACDGGAAGLRAGAPARVPRPASRRLDVVSLAQLAVGTAMAGLGVGPVGSLGTDVVVVARRRSGQEPRPRCPRPPPSSAVRSGSRCWAASGRSATAPRSARRRPTACRPGRATRSAAPSTSLASSRGRPRRGSSTAWDAFIHGLRAAAPGGRGHRRRDGGRCRAALVDRARSRGQRPSVLCEIRSQPWIL